MSRRAWVLCIGASAALLGVNAVAYMQARAMSHFVSGGTRTERPEHLSALEAAAVVFTGVRIPRPTNTATPADDGLAYETVRFPSLHGPTLEAWRIPAQPDGPIVIAFHGYAGSKDAVLPSARVLHARGYETLLVDFYGSGGSSGTDTSLGLLEARDVASAVDYVRHTAPGRPIVLFGFSMGGAAILRAIAAEGVRVDGIILEATFDRLLSTAANRFHTMGLPSTPFAELLLFWGGVQEGVDLFAHNPVDYARSVTCPTLILQGDSDLRVSPNEARAIRDAIGTRAELVLYPDVPHMLIAVARPAEWSRDVGAFLHDRIRPTAPS